ncbi:hypothetical protein Dimus_015286 [Dionaea muscipula]
MDAMRILASVGTITGVTKFVRFTLRLLRLQLVVKNSASVSSAAGSTPLGSLMRKRSCRKRLEGHNRRRRKPQPESLPLNPASFLSAAQGSRFLPFTGSAMIHSTSVVSPSAWSGSIKPAETTPTLWKLQPRAIINLSAVFI